MYYYRLTRQEMSQGTHDQWLFGKSVEQEVNIMSSEKG